MIKSNFKLLSVTSNSVPVKVGLSLILVAVYRGSAKVAAQSNLSFGTLNLDAPHFREIVGARR